MVGWVDDGVGRWGEFWEWVGVPFILAGMGVPPALFSNLSL